MTEVIKGCCPTLTIGDVSVQVELDSISIELAQAPYKVLIFGVTGQDGSYLAEQLLDKGCTVYGVARRVSVDNTWRLKNVLSNERFVLLQGDVTDLSSVQECLRKAKPWHVYNLTAQSHVGTSFGQPKLTTDVTYLGALNILEACRMWEQEHGDRFRIYQASSSEMFGENYTEMRWENTEVCLLQQDIVCESGEKIKAGNYLYLTDDGKLSGSPYRNEHKYQDETTPFFPCSPYGVAKLAAHHLCRVYRKSYNMDVRCGILFNHESPRRGEGFVTQKIVKYLGDLIQHEIANNLKVNFDLGKLEVYEPKREQYKKLQLGNCDAMRDWGHARDYMNGIIKFMEKHDLADDDKDLVFGTGETYSVREFVKEAFDFVQISSERFVEYDVYDCKRPFDVEYLRARPYKARNLLDWEPRVGFKGLVEDMIKEELASRGILQWLHTHGRDKKV